MDSGGIATLLLSHMEKTAKISLNPARWIWKEPGKDWAETGYRALSLPFLPVAAGAAVTGKAALELGVKPAGKVIARAAEEAPLSTAGIIGAPLVLGPSAVLPAMSAESKERARQNAMLAQQLGESYKMKRASSLFSAEDLREGLALRNQLEKTAKGLGASEIFQNPEKLFLAGALLAAGSGAAGAGGQLASHLVGRGTEALHKSQRDKHFKKVLKADPSLKREKMAKPYFNVLHRASPYIATEPHVAAATLRTMIDAPEDYGAAPESIRQILQVEESRQKTRFPALRMPSMSKIEMPGSLE
jgi:hypothetical protein